MASKVVDVALEKISKKYPNFSAESGRKVVDSLQNAYKSYQNKKKTTVEGKNVPAENHSLIDMPSDSAESPPNKTLQRNDSFYENFEDYLGKNKSSENSTQKFPSASTVNGNGVGGSPSTHQLLSDNPSSTGAAKDSSVDNEKKELIGNCPVVPETGPPKPPEQPKNDISHYLQKKSLAQGMMDLALLSANTNQLRYILDSRTDNAYFNVSLTLIISSLVLQVVVGMMLVYNSQFNVQRKSGFASADRINNLSVFGVFLITLINVFVSTFGNVPASGSAAAPSTSTTAAVTKEGSVTEAIETTTAMIIMQASIEEPIVPID